MLIVNTRYVLMLKGKKTEALKYVPIANSLFCFSCGHSRIHLYIVCYCIISSMGQDEEMDTSPLGPTQPFFLNDKETQRGSDEDKEDKRDESGSEEEEDTDFTIPEDEEVDDEASVTNKASVFEQRENEDCAKINENHSETESSEDDEQEEDQGGHNDFKEVNCNPHYNPPCQTLAS